MAKLAALIEKYILNKIQLLNYFLLAFQKRGLNWRQFTGNVAIVAIVANLEVADYPFILPISLISQITRKTSSFKL